MLIEPTDPRYRILPTANGLQITIPGSRNPFHFIFFIAWIGIGAMMAYGILRLIFAVVMIGLLDSKTAGNEQVPAVVIIVLSIFAIVLFGIMIFGSYRSLREIFGNEIIEISNQSIRLSRKVFGLGREKEYQAAGISEMLIAPTVFSSIQGCILGGGPLFRKRADKRLLVFTYDHKQVRFGRGLKEAEAKTLLREMFKQYPQYRASKEIGIPSLTEIHQCSLQTNFIGEFGEGLTIILPHSNKARMLLLVFGWLIVWGLIILSMVRLVRMNVLPGEPEILIFFILMLGIELFTGFRLVWQFFGKEIVHISHTILTIEYRLFGMNISKQFHTAHIRDFRIISQHWREWYRQKRTQYIWNLNISNTLAFDYGAKTIQLGSEVSDTNAAQVLAAVVRRFPQLYGEKLPQTTAD